MLSEPIPQDIINTVLKVGRAEWGATAPKSSEEHAAHVKSSVELTAEHFEQAEPQSMHGLYMEGSETVICHSGTSPNSPTIARALTAAWNALHAQCAAENFNRTLGMCPPQTHIDTEKS